MTQASETPGAALAAPRVRGFSLRLILFAALLLVILGLAGGGWLMNRWLADRPANSETEAKLATRVAPVAALVPTATADGSPAAPTALVVAPVDNPAALAARVAGLEQRLRQIMLQADSASGNAARAEGLLIAFAVRRALDRGLALGYLDGQLRLRFGDAQPNAVKTIVDAARNPVTLDRLRADLDRLAPELLGRAEGSGNLWTGIRRELSELFIVRPAESPSPLASARLARARRNLDAGLVDEAVEEVAAMPGQSAAEQWMIDARRYHEARRALDLIETAAILEPRDSAPVALPRQD